MEGDFPQQELWMGVRPPHRIQLGISQPFLYQATVTFGDVKRGPMLNSFIRGFKIDPNQAIQELMQQTGGQHK